MPIVYNANEIIRIGVEIEKNGLAFYRQAATLAAGDADMERLFSDLAGWEETHVALFESFRRELPKTILEEDAYDQDEEMARYLKAAADSHVFHVSHNIAELAKGCRNVVEALNLALRFEKDSVVVYTTMKELVPPALGNDAIERLIREELMHISFISNQLAVL